MAKLNLTRPRISFCHTCILLETDMNITNCRLHAAMNMQCIAINGIIRLHEAMIGTLLRKMVTSQEFYVVQQTITKKTVYDNGTTDANMASFEVMDRNPNE